MRYRLAVSLLLSFISTLLISCTTVQPWEKDLLAKPSMALVTSKMDNALDEHIYFSKEASLGGQGVGGGGCGCN